MNEIKSIKKGTDNEPFDWWYYISVYINFKNAYLDIILHPPETVQADSTESFKKTFTSTVSEVE